MKKIFKYLNIEISPAKQGGFTLVETLVAVSIFSVSILGLLALLTDGVADTSYAKQKLLAAYLAQEGIEYVRNMRDTELLYGEGDTNARWNRFKNTPSISYPVPADFTGFTREVWLNKDDLKPDEVKITSKVEWTQGSGMKSITFSENLFNWIE